MECLSWGWCVCVGAVKVFFVNSSQGLVIVLSRAVSQTPSCYLWHSSCCLPGSGIYEHRVLRDLSSVGRVAGPWSVIVSDCS